VASISGPKFVFVHIVAPHPPFVFGPNGEFVVRNTPLTLNYDLEDREWDRYVPGYRGQVTYLNNRFITILKAILEESPRSPIIVLQSDHGITRVSSARERVAILNAYHLPDGGNEFLYPSISPVNTFRVIFNSYFGGSYDLLEDVSYLWMADEGPYEFEVVHSTSADCGE
jgi:arylsulfatase A-like enzyme